MCLGSGVPGGSARAAPRGVLGGLQFLALKITSLIKVFYSLVYKVLFNQFRLFFDNSFFPRSLAQALICSTFPTSFDVFHTSFVRRSLRLIFF